MISFLQICEEVKTKLGRQLYEEELKFLQWLYSRYINENQEMTKLDV